jgi:transcriptional regulator with XRE-family HTH domain
MHEFELTMRLRNNLLKRRRLELGLSTHEMAKRIGINYSTYIGFEGLKRSPVGYLAGRLNSAGPSWTPSALKIAAYYGCSPEELFPGAVLAVTKPEVAVEMSANEALAIAAHCAERSVPMLPDAVLEAGEDMEEVDQALLSLTNRELLVLGKRYGLDGQPEERLSEVGKRIRLSRERTRQIECRALRKLRGAMRESRAKQAIREAMADGKPR